MSDFVSAASGGSGAQLHCVVEARTPMTTRDALRTACEARGVDYVEVDVDRFDWRRGPLEPGALLYTPAASLRAEHVELALWQPGVVSFHSRPEGPFVVVHEPQLAMARAGLPGPRWAWVTTRRRDALRSLVEHLGGLPLVVRVVGGEGGSSVTRVDSLASLFGLVDLLLTRGDSPRLVTYIPDAMHLRLVVVGGRVVCAYRNPISPDDFRSAPSSVSADYGIAVSEEAKRIADTATRVVGYEAGGVDLLEDPSGRLYVLESNFPFFFAHAQDRSGIDISGAMVDHLLAKRALARMDRDQHGVAV